MMDIQLKGKTAVVCGSSQGIGRAVARQLAKQGAHVVLFARNPETLQQVADSLDDSVGQQHQILTADFSDPDAVLASIRDWVNEGNSAEILVNNTGGPAPGLAHQADVSAYLAAFNQHLVNNQNLLQQLLPGMQEAGYGRVINVISTSVKQPLPALGVSNTIRGAVASWAKTIANELGQFNITVNNVLPGATETARLQSIFENKARKLGISLQEVIENERNGIPMRRFGQPEEFANVVGFLASPAAGYINGINVPVDGGRTGSL